MNTYSIDIFCSDDSRSHIFIPEFVETSGVGAAELHIIDLARELARIGNKVRLFNPCPAPGVYDDVEYLDVADFIPEEQRDVFILHRNPDPVLPYVNADLKIHESCDQQTSGNYATNVYPFVNAVTTISPYHKNYFVTRYGFDPEYIYPFDIGVRTHEYNKPIPKVPFRCVYTSTPSRGLRHLANIFPAIKFLFPDAELFITAPSWGYGLETQHHPDTALFKGMEGVRFLGKIPRHELVELQLSADLHLYPNDNSDNFGELFCVSIAESQVAGTIPVTTRHDGLATTVMLPGVFVEGTPQDESYRIDFIHAVTMLLADRKGLVKKQNELRANAIQRFSWERIGKQWMELFESLL